MITAQKLEVRAGARLLMEDVTFRIAAGDKVGLVGRNGAGKTTLTRILAGEGTPADGQVLRSGDVGYLPQDPRVGDPEVIARDRILSARGLDDVVRRLREAEHQMSSDDPAVRERAMKRYSRADADNDADCARLGVAVSLEDYWTETLPEQGGVEFAPAVINTFAGAVRTGCGEATSQVGPFYCPPDQQIFLDTTFFDQVLEQQLGGQ